MEDVVRPKEQNPADTALARFLKDMEDRSGEISEKAVVYGTAALKEAAEGGTNA